MDIRIRELGNRGEIVPVRKGNTNMDTLSNRIDAAYLRSRRIDEVYAEEQGKRITHAKRENLEALADVFFPKIPKGGDPQLREARKAARSAFIEGRAL